MTVPSVIAGQVIDPAWGNTVANDVNANTTRREQGSQFSATIPGGNIDATTSGTMTTWLTLNSINVPSWATVAEVLICAMSVYEIAAGGSNYSLQAQLGGTPGRTVPYTGHGASVRFPIIYHDRWTGLTSGLKVLVLQAARSSGTSQFRADTFTDITIKALFS